MTTIRKFVLTTRHKLVLNYLREADDKAQEALQRVSEASSSEVAVSMTESWRGNYKLGWRTTADVKHYGQHCSTALLKGLERKGLLESAMGATMLEGYTWHITPEGREALR